MEDREINWKVIESGTKTGAAVKSNEDAYTGLARASESTGCALWVGCPVQEDIKKIVAPTSSLMVQIIKPLKDREEPPPVGQRTPIGRGYQEVQDG